MNSSDQPIQKKNSNDQGDAGVQAIELLRRIRDKRIDGKSLGPEARRRLVMLLVAEGQSTPEMANLLGVCDRTIERDRKAIRRRNAVRPSDKPAQQMAGRLITEADVSTQRIRRFARENAVPAAVRVAAENYCFQIWDKAIERLQSLGHLPMATHKVKAELTHELGPTTLTLADIRREANRLAGIDRRNRKTATRRTDEVIAKFENGAASPLGGDHDTHE